MGLLSPHPGWCVFTSDSDSRWNFEVRARHLIVSSGELPAEAKEKVEEFTELYGKPPEDVVVHCIKD